jgi:prepilin-type N-terminal cleavage/methylation domain-containing protein
MQEIDKSTQPGAAVPLETANDRTWSMAANNGRHGTRRLQTTGFTLTELMIAIAIFGIGLAMAAALFPAAIKQNQSSVNNVMGSIICQNGLATVKALPQDKLETLQSRFDPGTTPTTLTLGADDSDTTIITQFDRDYRRVEPYAAVTTPQPYGYILLGRWENRPANVANGLKCVRIFQLAVVSYKRSVTPLANSRVTAQQVTLVSKLGGSNTADIQAFELNNGGLSTVELSAGPNIAVRPGTPLIFADNGEFAIVTKVSPGSGANNYVAVLDRIIDPSNARVTAGNTAAWIVQEQDNNGPPLPVSPAMSVLVTRTGLGIN